MRITLGKCTYIAFIAFIVAQVSPCSSQGNNPMPNIGVLGNWQLRENNFEIQKGFDKYKSIEYIGGVSELNKNFEASAEDLSKVLLPLPLTLEIRKISNQETEDSMNTLENFKICEKFQSGGKIACINDANEVAAGFFNISNIEKKGCNVEATKNKSNVRDWRTIKSAYLPVETGTNISMRNIKDLEKAINDHYYKLGVYGAYAFIPPQKVDAKGKLFIYVTEPKLNICNIKLKGKSGFAGDQKEESDGQNLLMSALNRLKIADGRPAMREDLEWAIVQMNNMPGYDVDAFVRPIMAKEINNNFSYIDSASVEIQYRKKTVLATMSYDDYGNDYIGPHMLMGNLELMDVFGGGEKINFSAVGAGGGEELKFAHFRGLIPLRGVVRCHSAPNSEKTEASQCNEIPYDNVLDNVEILLDWHTSRSRPGSTMKQFDVVSNNEKFTLGFRWHWWRGRLVRQKDWQNTGSDNSPEDIIRSYTGDWYTDLQYQQSESKTDFFGDTPVSDEHVRSVTLKQTFEGNGRLRLFSNKLFQSDRLVEAKIEPMDVKNSETVGAKSDKNKSGLRESYESSLSFSATRGLNFGDSTQKGSLLSLRGEADPDFFKLNASGTLTYQVKNFPDYPLSSFLTLEFDGQYAPKPLFSSHELSIGNRNGGRGFGPTEVQGDSGLGIRSEVGLARLFTFLWWLEDEDPAYYYDTNGERVKRGEYETQFIRQGQSTTSWSGYFFHDWGFARNHDQDDKSAGRASTSLSSLGVGLRIKNINGLALGFELAKPINHFPDGINDQSWRNNFSMQIDSDFIAILLDHKK